MSQCSTLYSSQILRISNLIVAYILMQSLQNKTQRKVPTPTNSRKERKVQLYYFTIFLSFLYPPPSILCLSTELRLWWLLLWIIYKIKSKRWRSIIGLSRDDYDYFDHMSFGFLNDELFEPRKRFMKRSHPILTRNQEKWLQSFSWHCLDLVKVSKWFSHPDFRSHSIT